MATDLTIPAPPNDLVGSDGRVSMETFTDVWEALQLALTALNNRNLAIARQAIVELKKRGLLEQP